MRHEDEEDEKVSLQSELKLLPTCEEKIRAHVSEKYLKGQDNASIAGVKLLYGGSAGGLHYDAVALVRTSEESEPRDFVVVTERAIGRDWQKKGCRIVASRCVGDGLLPEVEGLGQ